MALIIYAIPSDGAVTGKNKRIISEYLETWGTKVGIPFVPTITITGLQVEEKPVAFNANTIKEAAKARGKDKKRKVIASTEDQGVPDVDQAKPKKKGRVVENKEHEVISALQVEDSTDIQTTPVISPVSSSKKKRDKEATEAKKNFTESKEVSKVGDKIQSADKSSSKEAILTKKVEKLVKNAKKKAKKTTVSY
jgi:hypothetical protein